MPDGTAGRARRPRAELDLLLLPRPRQGEGTCRGPAPGRHPADSSVDQRLRPKLRPGWRGWLGRQSAARIGGSLDAGPARGRAGGKSGEAVGWHWQPWTRWWRGRRMSNTTRSASCLRPGSSAAELTPCRPGAAPAPDRERGRGSSPRWQRRVRVAKNRIDPGRRSGGLAGEW